MRVLKYSYAFGIQICLASLKIRVSHEAEQYRVIDHRDGRFGSETNVAITQTSTDPNIFKQTPMQKEGKKCRRKSQSFGSSFILLSSFHLSKGTKIYIADSLVYIMSRVARETSNIRQ